MKRNLEMYSRDPKHPSLCFVIDLDSQGRSSVWQFKENRPRPRLGFAPETASEFVDYILLNWDIINFCHEHDIPTGPGRGSAAGSLVLFLIGVTKIDPIKYDLFFERFVSQSRTRKIEKNGTTYLDGGLLADIDNDISYERRKEVIEYIEKKFPGRTAPAKIELELLHEDPLPREAVLQSRH